MSSINALKFDLHEKIDSRNACCEGRVEGEGGGYAFGHCDSYGLGNGFGKCYGKGAGYGAGCCDGVGDGEGREYKNIRGEQ